MSSTSPGKTLPVRDSGVFRASLGLTVVSLALFGFVYSYAGVGLGQLAFPEQANGSLLVQGERTVGSALVAQPFVGDGYFVARPSAASYDPMAVAGSNQARSNPDLIARIETETRAVAEREGIEPGAVPPDLVTQSGSGIDPHISVAAAQVQVARVARTRGVPPAVVQSIVEQFTTAAALGGLLGDAYVNVLALNLALDQKLTQKSNPSTQ